MTTKKTPLNAIHRRLGARMVDFGGWDMPLHYGSQLEEHHAVRRDCGVFDVSHMRVVDVAGAQAKDFLRRLLANDVSRFAAPGKALYSAMLNDAGGMLDDLIVYFVRDGEYRLVVNAGTAEKDLAWMAARLADGRFEASITPRPKLAIIAVQGPNAKARLGQVLPEARAASDGLKSFHFAVVGDHFISATGYTGEAGVEIVLPAARAEALWQRFLDAGAPPAGLGARDTLRLEAGMNLYGQDMDETVSPLDAGLAWTVELSSPRDFVGRAALLAKPQQKQFLGLVLLDKGVLRAHQKVFTQHGEGEITSGSFSPTLQKSIALARLPLAAAAGDSAEVDIRDKRHAARIVKPCFVRHGQALV